MKDHATHFDDCGCQSAALNALLDKQRADFAKEVDALEARIATLEAELAEANRGWQAASAACLAEIDARDMWQARADALRDAVEYLLAGKANAWQRVKAALSQTPAASLAALKAEVLERAAAMCAAKSHTDGWGVFFAREIRALAAQAATHSELEVKP